MTSPSPAVSSAHRRFSRACAAALLLLLNTFGAVFAQVYTCSSQIATSFTGWSITSANTVAHSETGLEWQRCALGQSWTGASCSGTATPKNWADAVSGAPAGWRLPNMKELESMVERRCASPALNLTAFPNTPSTAFWSSTPGWAVNMNDGAVSSGNGTTTTMGVRYVRNGLDATGFDAGAGITTNCSPNVLRDHAVNTFVVNAANGTVTDQSTGLIWQRCPVGTVLSGNRCTGTPAQLAWSLSTELNLLNAGWRLPNVKELESIVDRSCALPAVNGVHFPDTPAINFWSSTPGWAVSMNDGAVSSGNALTTAMASRLVKSAGGNQADLTWGGAGAGVCPAPDTATDFKAINWVSRADGSLLDSATGLIWDRCALGQLWSVAKNGCEGTPEQLKWSDALDRAEAAVYLNSMEWRLPNVKELESIIDRACTSPALNPDFFRGNRETMTWSFTPGWAVNMTDGAVSSGNAATTTMAVRFVRGGAGSAGATTQYPGVPGEVASGASNTTEDITNPALLAPSNGTQKLMLITHGWNADGKSWVTDSVAGVCARLGATVTDASIADNYRNGEVGIRAYCDTPQWRVVGLDWGRIDSLADNIVTFVKLPWNALARGRRVGESAAKILLANSNKYTFIHLVGHSAGANLIHELAGTLKRSGAASIPKIHSTFLDAFCGNADRCDYGGNSDWADSYYDANPLINQEGTETRRNLPYAANFDLSAKYPLAQDGLFINSVDRHAWPYRCYGNSIWANQAATGMGDFANIDCLSNAANTPGFGLSFIGSGATNVSTFLSQRNSAAATQLRTVQTLTATGTWYGASVAQTVGVSGIQKTVTAAKSSIAGAVVSSLFAPTSTCGAQAFIPNPVISGMRLLACYAAYAKRADATKSATDTPIASWAVLDYSTASRSNILSFDARFTTTGRSALSVYIDDNRVYETISALNGTSDFSSGKIDVQDLPPGAHKISFRLDPLDGQEAIVDIKNVELSVAGIALVATDGACGTDNGQVTATAPTANLCAAGTSSAVAAATNAWNWTCTGANGGASATCSAPYAATADAENDSMPYAVEIAEGRNPAIKDNAIFAGMNAKSDRWFAMQQYRDFLGREAETAGLNGWTGILNAGTQSREQVIQSFFNSQEFQNGVPPVVRLYLGYFNRIPDHDGLFGWVKLLREGMALGTVSGAFAASQEFQNTYGALSDADFVTLVYRNVLGRAPDTAGYNGWLSQLRAGLTRGNMMIGFTESQEYQNKTRNNVFVIMMYEGMLRRAAEQAGYDGWVNYMNAGNSGLALTSGFLNSLEYRYRFLPR